MKAPKILTATEWGALRAARAPIWSDKTWSQVCAILKLQVESPESSRKRKP